MFNYLVNIIIIEFCLLQLSTIFAIINYDVHFLKYNKNSLNYNSSVAMNGEAVA